MIGVHHAGDVIADVLPVVIGRIHEVGQLHKELILVKGDGLTNMDELVVGPERRIRLRARVSIFTGEPMSRTKISPPWA